MSQPVKLMRKRHVKYTHDVQSTLIARGVTYILYLSIYLSVCLSVYLSLSLSLSGFLYAM